MTRMLLALATLPLLAETNPATDTWPQWRGPTRDGYSQGQSWPEELSGLQQLWRVELDKGYPGPIVSSTLVFVAETANNDTEIVRALDRKTGREMWRAQWKGKISVPFFAKKNGDWIRSTPAFDGKTLYVGGMEEVLVALDGATGKELWRVDFPARFRTAKPDFGFASSPLIDGDALIIQAANSLVKIDRKTGSTLWRTLEHKDGMMESGAFSSPTIATLQGRRQLLVQTRTTLHGVDPATGESLWSHEVPNFRGMNILTPVAYKDSVFTSAYQNNSHLFSIGKTGGKLTAKEAWRNKLKGYMSTPVVVGDYAYLHMANQRFTCIDLRTGDIKWTTEPHGQYWSMAVRGEHILALDERGKLLLIRANPDKFELLDSKEITNSPAWAHVAVAGSEVYVRDLASITAYRLTAAKPQTSRSGE